MRFLPVFLDLQTGPVLLVGAGDLARAKLRLLAAAGARVRWFATDGNHDVAGLEAADAARIEHATDDPLIADLKGVIAILCAGAGDIGIAMSVRAKAVGIPVNVMDDLAHSTFIFPAIVDRGDVVVAVGTGGASPVVARRVRESIEAVLPAQDRRSRRLHRPLAQIDPWPDSRIFLAPPFLGTRDRWTDRRAGACRTRALRPKPRCKIFPTHPPLPAQRHQARPRAG